MGLAYSPFRGDESPDYDTYPPLADIAQDLTNNLIFLASEISIYSMDGTLSNIPSLCDTYGIPCYPCAYVSSDLADTTNELNALIAVGNQNFPTTRGLIVGSEALLDGYDVDTLISNINYVRAATFTNVPVGTREDIQDITDNPQLAAACDFLQIDIHPYYYQVPIADAAAWAIQQWQQLTNQFPNTRVEIGETGWPTGGTNVFFDNPDVVASVTNQGLFLSQFVPLARSNGIEYFIFDFRDESWMVQEGYGTASTNWGLYDGWNNKKQSLTDYLASGFTLQMLSAASNTASILVQTYDSDPYALFGTTNLLESPGNLIANFTGAPGTNQTVVTVTNSSLQPACFYKASQGF